MFVRCFYYFQIVVMIMPILVSNGQNQCPTATSNNQQGFCISIYDCSSILNLLRQSSMRKLTNDEIITAQNSQCGYDGDVPLVCCPKKNDQATPIPFNSQMNIESKSGFDVANTGPPNVTNHRNLKLLDQNICGPITETRIIRGNKTTVLEYPWMALIAYKINENEVSFKCGGSLINKRYVLTAAHCVTRLDPNVELIGVRIGDHDIGKKKDCDLKNGVEIVCADEYQEFYIEKVHVHEEFGKKKHQNDIALIRLKGEADFKHLNVKPICLPIGDAVNAKSKKGIVTGWGRTETGFRSQILLQVKLDIVDNAECEKVYKNQGIEISYKQLCAGGKTSMDSCAGDSGGPLQYTGTVNQIPKYIQYGIVGFGTETCGIIGYPGVYTRVVYYMDWILDNISE